MCMSMHVYLYPYTYTCEYKYNFYTYACVCTKLLKLHKAPQVAAMAHPTHKWAEDKDRWRACWSFCVSVPFCIPNVDRVLLSYHCHTFCHTVVIPWASIWSLCRFCQFCRAVLSTNLPRRMCQANLPHVVIPVVIPLLSYLVVIPVVNRCCHTQGLCVEAAAPDWHAAIYILEYMCIY